MEDYTINVTEIEELQTLKDNDALDNIFTRAKSAIVNGAQVQLIRKGFGSSQEPFDSITTLEDLEKYRKGVLKYL